MHGSAQKRHGQAGSANPGSIVARAPRTGQSAPAALQHGSLDGPYRFLVQASISDATLAIAEAEGRRCGAPTHAVLIAAGHITHMAYASALAGWLGVPVAGWDAVFKSETLDDLDEVKELGLPAHVQGQACRVLCAEDGTPDALSERVSALQARGLNVALSSRFRA